MKSIQLTRDQLEARLTYGLDELDNVPVIKGSIAPALMDALSDRPLLIDEAPAVIANAIWQAAGQITDDGQASLEVFRHGDDLIAAILGNLAPLYALYEPTCAALAALFQGKEPTTATAA